MTFRLAWGVAWSGIVIGAAAWYLWQAQKSREDSDRRFRLGMAKWSGWRGWREQIITEEHS